MQGDFADIAVHTDTLVYYCWSGNKIARERGLEVLSCTFVSPQDMSFDRGTDVACLLWLNI